MSLLNIAANGFECHKKWTFLMSQRNRFFNVAANGFLMSQKSDFECLKEQVL